jgi:hypothetical protein
MHSNARVCALLCAAYFASGVALTLHALRFSPWGFEWIPTVALFLHATGCAGSVIGLLGARRAFRRVVLPALALLTPIWMVQGIGTLETAHLSAPLYAIGETAGMVWVYGLDLSAAALVVAVLLFSMELRNPEELGTTRFA